MAYTSGQQSREAEIKRLSGALSKAEKSQLSNGYNNLPKYIKEQKGKLKYYGPFRSSADSKMGKDVAKRAYSNADRRLKDAENLMKMQARRRVLQQSSDMWSMKNKGK